jgi:hypothetical protein
MYADDILILSQSAQGLQCALNKLNKYSKKWKLEVNPQKTKTMIFNSRRACQTFTIGSQVLQQVDRALYLGFILTPSGKFRAMQKYLYNKACKALYSLRSALRGCTYMSVNTQLKLFDVMIKPILLYGSDVWGAYMYKYKNNKCSLNCIIKNVNTWMEKVHSKICKYVLRVHKNTNNFAVRCELGRYPLFVNIISRMINYYNNICMRNEFSLVHKALEIHKSTDESWFSFLKYIVQILGFNINYFCKDSVCKKLICLSNDIFIKKLNDYNSLKLYSSIKCQVNQEKYLSLVKNEMYRQSVTRVRLSCHNFPIQTGRYNNVEEKQRICTKCNINIGTEYHCIMECFNPNIAIVRNNFLLNMYDINPSLRKLNRLNLFKYMILCTDTTILYETSKFIHEIVKNVY